MNKNTKNSYMAFGKAAELTEATVARKRYIGYTNVNIVGINPNKAEWEKLYGISRDDEINYLTESVVNNVPTKRLRIDFIIKTDPTKSGGVEITDKMSYFVSNTINYSRDGSKVEMIDAYGDCVYLPVEEAKEGIVSPSILKAGRFKGTDMRPAFVGEKSLTDFIRNYLGIPNRYSWNPEEKNWTSEIANTSDALCRLENIEKYFQSGDISEIKSLPNNNQVKVLFGVKKTDDGKIYSDIYTKMVLKMNAAESSWKYLESDVKNAKELGQYPNTIFEVVPFKEFVPEKSEVKTPIWSEQTPPTSGGLNRFFGGKS